MVFVVYVYVVCFVVYAQIPNQCVCTGWCVDFYCFVVHCSVSARRQKIQVDSSTSKKQTPEQKQTLGQNDPSQEIEGKRGSEGTEQSKEKLSNKDFRKMFGV